MSDRVEQAEEEEAVAQAVPPIADTVSLEDGEDSSTTTEWKVPDIDNAESTEPYDASSDEDPELDPSDAARIMEELDSEQQRTRSDDLSYAFVELESFLDQVFPDKTDKRGTKRKSIHEDSTRLELLGRSLKTMKRLHRENEGRKRLIAELEGRVGEKRQKVV